ncbi:uncharacterized protein LOC143615018 [Bidens hawaiensis]|uniref:uncharacterized protein LOC143615018 n=1 Tax=Bidens hawaiensis TaxID=980011 RepID=UPI00404B21E6
MSCYEIDNYICEQALPEMKSTDHPATIRLGTNIILNHVTAPQDFPQFYFRLSDYNQLCERVHKRDCLTDYAGRLDTATPDKTSNGKSVIRLNMTDISGKAIEVTIWEEIMPQFSSETMQKTDPPIIIVLTSTKVAKFLEKIQLSSTAATHIYFDPPTEKTSSSSSSYSVYPTNSKAMVGSEEGLFGTVFRVILQLEFLFWTSWSCRFHSGVAGEAPGRVFRVLGFFFGGCSASGNRVL